MRKSIKVLLVIFCYLLLFTQHLKAKQETFTPYKAGEVPQNVTDLWKGYDARKEALDVEIIKEWKQDGVVTSYITFKVGTFKGADARIAAFYSFPDNGKKNPAFVWSHGGGQRAEKERGIYFAKHGFATVDINWNGRSMEKGIDENTDWGKVDATQGPKFYPKALRNQWKNDLKPDRYSIDPVPSPRNSNYFLVSLAGRRAITFLEQQPEVDAEKCNGCGKCGQLCQYSAIICIKDSVLTFEELCHSCGGCMAICPESAIREKQRKIGIAEFGRSDGVFFGHGKRDRHLVGDFSQPPVGCAGHRVLFVN